MTLETQAVRDHFASPFLREFQIIYENYSERLIIYKQYSPPGLLFCTRSEIDNIGKSYDPMLFHCIISQFKRNYFITSYFMGINYDKHHNTGLINLLDDAALPMYIRDLNNIFEFKNTQFYEFLNMILISDHQSMIETFAIDIMKITNIIKLSNKKHKGLCYMKSLLNPLEIGLIIFRQQFFIPCFLNTFIKKEDSLREEGNVLFCINTEQYNELTTIYGKTDSRCLISCYNLFSIIAFEKDNNHLIIELKINDPSILENYLCCFSSNPLYFPELLFKSGSSTIKDRNLSIEETYESIQELKEFLIKKNLLKF
jgi:hypothetical protein